MRRIAILGSTGSIGRSAVAVALAHPQALQVTGLAAGRNTAAFVEQVERLRPTAISMGTEPALRQVREALSPGARARLGAVAHGQHGLTDVATRSDVDIVLCASSGTAALEAVLAAIEAGKTIALANKEVLVMAGELVMAAAARHGVSILPVDSEHSALHQCLHQRGVHEVRRLILTASGGPFREWTVEAMDRATPEDALSHPTWRMGRKITIDSATMMNKGLEVIEARWLFDIPAARIDVVIHPQSVVHSLVELCDGSMIAQLGVTDMRLPIQYAFSYPERWETHLPPLDLTRLRTLEFLEPSHGRFPCLGLAYQALGGGGAAPAVLNAANETAVEAFLEHRLPFTAIPRVIAQTLDAHAAGHPTVPRDLADVRAVDRWAHAFSQEQVREVQSKA
ncbi:MAG: 1-deoxy-D-xylulose-5-phosphate reductoisomerase [Vicinamibacterales bacterium]